MICKLGRFLDVLVEGCYESKEDIGTIENAYHLLRLHLAEECRCVPGPGTLLVERSRY